MWVLVYSRMCLYERMYMYRVGVGEQTGCGCIECLCIDCMWLYKGVYMYRVDDGV